jgi:hypothetical protein
VFDPIFSVMVPEYCSIGEALLLPLAVFSAEHMTAEFYPSIELFLPVGDKDWFFLM